jgi:hypothetical protein
MSGTDPYNPLSKPSLLVIAEVGGKKRLPSFEAGLGAFFVFPEKLQAFVAERVKDPLAAFPMGSGRGDSLSRVGISAVLLKEHGLDAHLDGFTIGIEQKTDAGMPGRRVGGIEARLISEEDDLTPLPDLPKRETELADGTIFTEYRDGTMTWDRPDGSHVAMDKNGDDITIYVNPDADPESTVPTPEQKVAFERLRGTAIRTVEGWLFPLGDNEPGDKRETVVLLDPEYAYNPAMIYEAPRLTNAQPEVRPDLPRPDLPADPKGGCTVGCP